MPYEPLTIAKEEVQELIIDMPPTELEYEAERRDSLEFYDPYSGSGISKKQLTRN